MSLSPTSGRGDATGDLVIVGARVIDGTGRPPRTTDVRIHDGIIDAVGTIARRPSDRVRDASGLVVTPGFIDTHAHDDTAALHPDGLRAKREQGVTTVVTGNCGIGVAPWSAELEERLSTDFRAVLGFAAPTRHRTFRDYVDALDSAPLQTNVRPLVAHAALRFAAEIDNQSAPADARGRSSMRSLLRDAIAQGAAGMSTGLVYDPCRHADTAELIALGATLAEQDAVLAVHVRDEGAALLPSLQEVITVARRSGCRLHVSHLKATGRGSVEQIKQALDLIDDARADGVDLTFDAYPYAAGSTALLPALRADANREEGTRSNVQLAAVSSMPQLSGRWLADVAAERGLTVHETAKQILEISPGASAIIHMMDPESVRLVLAHDLCLIGSDGLPDPDGHTHPRQYGTFPRIIERYCGPGGLPLHEVIHRMTSLPAARFAIPDRGRIEPGFVADLVLFDPAAIAETGTFSDPARRPRGIADVFLAGRVDADEDPVRGRAL